MMPATDRREPTPGMVKRASMWAARLDGEESCLADRRAFDLWCAEDPRHREVYSRMTGLDDRLAALDQTSRSALSASLEKPKRRSSPVGAVTAVVALLMAGWVGTQNLAFRSLTPDVRTKAGEQRSMKLPDGSVLVADTATALDIGRREVLLFDGRVLATVAADPGRPFVVRTAEGRATALGTRYTVQRENHVTRVTVIESRVEICPNKGACRTLSAGEQVEMNSGGIGPIRRVDPVQTSLWSTGWAELDDRPLPEFLAELSRYSAAPIRYDADRLADVRVTGSYPLTDPEASLRAISTGFALTLETAPDGSLTISR